MYRILLIGAAANKPVDFTRLRYIPETLQGITQATWPWLIADTRPEDSPAWPIKATNGTFTYVADTNNPGESFAEFKSTRADDAKFTIAPNSLFDWRASESGELHIEFAHYIGFGEDIMNVEEDYVGDFPVLALYNPATGDKFVEVLERRENGAGIWVLRVHLADGTMVEKFGDYFEPNDNSPYPHKTILIIDENGVVMTNEEYEEPVEVLLAPGTEHKVMSSVGISLLTETDPPLPGAFYPTIKGFSNIDVFN